MDWTESEEEATKTNVFAAFRYECSKHSWHGKESVGWKLDWVPTNSPKRIYPAILMHDAKDKQEFTPHSGYYRTGNGDCDYAFQGEQEAYAACDSEMWLQWSLSVLVRSF